MAYRLTVKAEEDVIRIFAEGARLFGIDLAVQYHRELEGVFGLIADNPLLARERQEIVPPIRVHPHKAYLILYAADNSGDVLVIRVRHGHEDWESQP